MYSNESDVQESRGFDISWMQTIMNGLILWLCMVCHVYHTLHEGWMLSSRLEVFGRNIGVIQGSCLWQFLFTIIFQRWNM